MAWRRGSTVNRSLLPCALGLCDGRTAIGLPGLMALVDVIVLVAWAVDTL